MLLPPSQNDGSYSHIFLSQNFCPTSYIICPKMDVRILCDLLNDIKKTFNTGLDIRGSKSNILETQSHHQEDFRHRNFRGCF